MRIEILCTSDSLAQFETIEPVGNDAKKLRDKDKRGLLLRLLLLQLRAMMSRQIQMFQIQE